jgi:hypothetical protein
MNRQTLLLLIFSFSGFAAHAYPSYISYGYQSCMSCHYNPMGNGPLTDYGRSVAASLLSDRIFWSKSVPDEKLADRSGFFFSAPQNNWFRPSASYRGLYMESNFGKQNSADQYITMDASASVVLKFLKDDKLTFVSQLSYAPTPLSQQNSGKKYENYRSREHYVGYRFNKEFGLYAGLMDKSFGIRIPDHIAFSRTVTGLAEDDQSYGLMAHYLTGQWEFVLQPFIGNFVQENSLRQKGATAQVGYALQETVRLGGSVLRSTSDYRDLLMYSVDARIGAGKGYSWLLEVGQVESAIKGGSRSTSLYFFSQGQFLVHRGLYPLITVEALQPDIENGNRTYRFGPGLQYLMAQRIELRADFYDTRGMSSSTYSDDNWTATAQIHLWF